MSDNFMQPFDENLVLGDKGYLVDDGETLADLGVPEAVKLEVLIHTVDKAVVIAVEFPEYTNYYGTGETVESLNDYLSLEDLKTYISKK